MSRYNSKPISIEPECNTLTGKIGEASGLLVMIFQQQYSSYFLPSRPKRAHCLRVMTRKIPHLRYQEVIKIKTIISRMWSEL